MTAVWTAGIALAALLAVPALNGCDRMNNPPRPKTLDVDAVDGSMTLGAFPANSAHVVDRCADVGGFARKLCKADIKIEAARGRLKQHQSGPQAERTEPSHEALVWAPDTYQAVHQRLGDPAGEAP
jgi:hypothetical protein